MTIAILDVQYLGAGARAACVVAEHWTSVTPLATWCADLDTVADYAPGEFYKRELPCLLRVLQMLPAPADILVVDGYVWLSADAAPGLGARLHEAMGASTPVVGVAKTAFRTVVDTPLVMPVLRGDSARPLYVSAVGIETALAAEQVRRMQGAHRTPTLLSAADRLARTGAT